MESLPEAEVFRFEVGDEIEEAVAATSPEVAEEIVITGVTRGGTRFRQPTPERSDLPEKAIEDLQDGGVTLYNWSMKSHDHGSSSRGLRRYSGALGTIELDDFMQEFDSWCDMQLMRASTLFTPFMAWKGLFHHLEGPPMDDYHDFRREHEKEIEI